MAPDLRDWGFNSVGWMQEVVIAANHLATPAISPSKNTNGSACLTAICCPSPRSTSGKRRHRQPDFFSPDFAEWCDYVARAECSRFADDPKLIGYFYIDCPHLGHTTGRATSGAGRSSIPKARNQPGRAGSSTTRHQVLPDDARRHPTLRSAPPHPRRPLRGQGPAPTSCYWLPSPLSMCSVSSISARLRKSKLISPRFHEQTGLPVLYADGCVPEPLPDGSKRHSPAGYAQLLEMRSGAWMHASACTSAGLPQKPRPPPWSDREDESPDTAAIAGIRLSQCEYGPASEAALTLLPSSGRCRLPADRNAQRICSRAYKKPLAAHLSCEGLLKYPRRYLLSRLLHYHRLRKLNYCVRDGNRCVLSDMVTGKGPRRAG